jgi:hypothetical protein
MRSTVPGGATASARLDQLQLTQARSSIKNRATDMMRALMVRFAGNPCGSSGDAPSSGSAGRRGG